MVKINGNPQHYVYLKAEQDYSSRPLAGRITDEALILNVIQNLVARRVQSAKNHCLIDLMIGRE